MEKNNFKKFKVTSGRHLFGHDEASAPPQQIVVEQVPPFRDCTYFTDPTDHRMFLISDDTLKHRFRVAGFQEISVTHVTGAQETIPRLAGAVLQEEYEPQRCKRSNEKLEGACEGRSKGEL
jgi:hypothetical protein